MNNSNKILVIIPKEVSAEIYPIIKFIDSIIKRELEQEVIFLGRRFLDLGALKKYELLQENIVDEIPASKFKLSVPCHESIVKNVQWVQDDSDLNIFITLDNGQIVKNDISTEAIDTKFKNIILMNIDNIAVVRKFISIDRSHAPDIFTLGRTTLDNVDDLNITKLNQQSLSQAVFELIKRHELNIEKDEATMLLTAIHIETNNFTATTVDEKTFELSAELAKLGANNIEALELSKELNSVNNDGQD